MTERDVFSYNTMITGLMQCGDVDGARHVFDRMIYRDVVTWNSMVSGYIRNGMIGLVVEEVGSAIELFESMPTRDTAAWNATIFGLSENDLGIRVTAYRH
ncbi:hypothetical protein CerSpe_004970 [Prunus speciosa]